MTAVLRVFEYNVRVYRHTWRGTVFTTFLFPILFLASMGIGLGSFVDRGGGAAALGGVSYLAFLAPGLLATQGMQTAASESTWPITGKIIWDRTYHGMLATPITVPAIVIGQFLWIVARLVVMAVIFFGVMVAFGVVASPLGVLGIAASVLTGVAFAAPIMAFTATRRDESAFNALFRFIITPLFLLSGAFFPIEQLPALIRPFAMVTPTWHGVALARGLSLGTIDPLAALAHVAVLVAFTAVGLAAGFVTFRRALVK